MIYGGMNPNSIGDLDLQSSLGPHQWGPFLKKRADFIIMERFRWSMLIRLTARDSSSINKILNYMSVGGSMTRNMEKEGWLPMIITFMRDIFRTIINMVKECIYFLKAKNILDNGRTDNIMEKGCFYLLMAQRDKGLMWRTWNTELLFILKLMEQSNAKFGD